jgi:hypothetical protein
VSEWAICIYKMETLAVLRYEQIIMVTACRQGERGSMSDSGCNESSLPVCRYTFRCLLAGQTGFYSRPRRRLLFASVFRLPVGTTQALFPACTEASVPCRTVADALVWPLLQEVCSCTSYPHVSLDVVLKHGVNFPSLYTYSLFCQNFKTRWNVTLILPDRNPVFRSVYLNMHQMGRTKSADRLWACRVLNQMYDQKGSNLLLVKSATHKNWTV